MPDHIPTDDDITATIDRIENGDWDVTDFNLQAGMYDVPKITIEVEYTPSPDYDEREAIRTVRQVVNRLEDKHEEGAFIEDVVEQAGKILGIDKDKVSHELEKLKKQGEIYEPHTEYLRTT